VEHCVHLLKKEADLLPVQATLPKDGQVAKRQRKTSELHDKIHMIWDYYRNQRISTLAVLKEVAKLYHPMD
jgi:hypothetical protein